ncbi:cell division protein FtsQ [Bifidobacterium sp. DSM 109960]|uniref:Cell division protein FtsQ n=1 Tax=Bifidobacterium erythrocebi TaxID=2675325 RepID=A0A7Y0ETQ1_9BIFI|nr:FtsQ-type POTRA domain-containing protein [Bifidobacterium sp. DSM 109960]NMM95803.1 cell division protein FtsQ [Bifidobacterium sp. DSM 109960]
MSGRVVRSGPDHQGRKPRTLTGKERNASTPEQTAGGKQEARHPIKPSTRTQLRRAGAVGSKQRPNAKTSTKANGKAVKAGAARNVASQGAQRGSATGRNVSGGTNGPRRRTPYKSSTGAGNARNARSAGAVAVPGQRRSVSGNAGGARRTVESHGGAAGGRISRSEPGSFVDARQLASEDLVAKTLRESSGTFGMAARPKVVDFTARAKERKRVNARIIIGRIIIAVVSVLAVIGLGWLLFFSPVLQLNSAQISVEGLNGWVSESEVRSLAVEQVDRSLLLVDTSKIASQARDIPGVSDARVSRAFPHGLTISLTTQRPAAMLKTPSGTVAAVDSQYRVLNVISQSDSVGIPVIEVGDIESSVKNRSVKEAVKILDSLPESMRKQITKVSAKTQDSVTTELNDGEHSVVWGDSSDIELKKADVDKILSNPNVIGDKKQVDVSSPYHPVLR